LGAIDVTNIDKQRVAAVRKSKSLVTNLLASGCDPANDASAALFVPAVTDPMHALLVQRADCSRAVRRAQSRRLNSRSSSTRSRPTQSAGRSARSREGEG